MRNYSDKISPNLMMNAILATGIVVLGYLILVGYKGNPPITPHPAVPFVCGIMMLLFSSKTIYFSDRQISIRRLLFIFNREISWEMVHHIEVIDDRYIFIALDGCPSFKETGMSPKSFILLFSRDLIKIDILSTKQKHTYIEILQKYHPDIHFVRCNTA